MISLLSRLLIKNREQTADPAVRRAYGTLCGCCGIVLNVLLIPWLGASGAAIATVIVTLSVAAMDCGYVLHYFRKEE